MFAKNKHDYLDKVIRSGLCTRCGSCVGLSQGYARFVDREGSYLPFIEPDTPEDVIVRMQQGCSGAEVDFPRLNHFAFNNGERHPYIGHFKTLGISYSTNKSLRRKSASGGVLSSILLWLLERGYIQGAVVTGMDEKQPWLTKSFIACTKEEIISAAQSKYIITSVNEILPEMEAFDGNLAYVGLPCQVHSIRKLQMAKDPAVRKIKYIFGPYCGNALHFSSVISLLRSYGEKNFHHITRLSFREGEWPGKTCIELESGRQIMLEKFHANYLIPFHIMKRCLLCTDLSNEFTDISGGDAWAPVYEERGKGFSLVIGRSHEGRRILSEMVSDKILNFEKVSPNDVLSMHSHGYDLKKRGAFLRIRFRRFFGRAVPEYDYSVKISNFSRYIMEIIIDLIFGIASTSLAKSLLVRIKPEWMGRVFKKLRTLWKKITRKTKRSSLFDQ